jgi:hypothetical protein
MKTSLIISLLCLSAMGGYAQSVDDEATARQDIHNKALEIYCRTNGNMGPGTIMHYKTNYSNVHAAYPTAPANAVPAWPSGSYTALQEPPCYKYKNSEGKWVTTCPGASFAPPQCQTPEAALNQIEQNGNLNVKAEKSYTGNYPDLHSVYPQAPANAVPAWPSGEYTQLKDPPCYEYTNKRGLKVTECPGAQFEPEHKYR